MNTEFWLGNLKKRIKRLEDRCRIDDNIKMDLKEKGVDSFPPAQNVYVWRAVVNTIMNRGGLQAAAIGFSRRTPQYVTNSCTRAGRQTGKVTENTPQIPA